MRFFNRELSWIDFNGRVLAEALRPELPLLARLSFLAIVSRNFDEFFMVRVGAAKRALAAGDALPGPDALAPSGLLARIADKTRELCAAQSACFCGDLLPAFAAAGLPHRPPGAWTAGERAFLEGFFRGRVLPLLSPLRLEEGAPPPAIRSLLLHTAFLLAEDGAEGEGTGGGAPSRIALAALPRVLDRVIPLPPEEGGAVLPWALLEDLVREWGRLLFPGFSVKGSLVFRVTRDADVPVDEQRQRDFVAALEEVLEERGTSAAVRMEYGTGSDALRQALAAHFTLNDTGLFHVDGPLNLAGLSHSLLRTLNHANPQARAAAKTLSPRPWKAYPHPAFRDEEPLFDLISKGDILLKLPYQRFDPVLRFFREAARDPYVLCIKATLYRISSGASVPGIVKALEQAALAGKHVLVVVELKARFDEERNISWAGRLERAGALVVYGIAGLKVHAKAALVLRREGERVRRYAHLATGNYNEATAKLYADLGLFTADEDIAYDLGLFFNMITGYSAALPLRRLSLAPSTLKRRLLDLIERETARSSPASPGRIAVKVNALADPDVIEALYRASQAGVRVQLNVRGVCLLVPGVPGLSENISVVSIVGHYLEHARICAFGPPGAEALYISSADWMPRNLERRVELLIPILQDAVKAQVRMILDACFADNSQAWRLLPSGAWERLAPRPGEAPFRAQEHLLAAAAKDAERPLAARGEFVVRRASS